MKTKLSTILFIALFFQTVIYAQTINTEKSVVNFEINTMGLFGINGTFTGFSGNIIFNTSQLNQAEIAICIDATTLKTGNESRDEHVKSEDFLNVKKYAKICFTSTSIQSSEDGYLAVGTLQLHGITKTIQIPLTYTNKTLKGHLEVNRLDYNIGEDISTFKAGKTVDISITCVLK